MTAGGLWEWPDRPESHGRVRTALELDIDRLTGDGAELPAAPLATLRVLADQMDVLDRHMRTPGQRVKPYERVPLATLAGQLADIYERFISTAGATDEFADALEEFRRAESGDAAAPWPAN